MLRLPPARTWQWCTTRRAGKLQTSYVDVSLTNLFPRFKAGRRRTTADAEGVHLCRLSPFRLPMDLREARRLPCLELYVLAWREASGRELRVLRWHVASCTVCGS